ncbi:MULTISPECIES: PAS domain S-box protein [unclassified Archaeoglobus]|jgi:PAS domain S-box-containing protein|uniref:PAS domain S-box protein n=1 Tax=unclassified Archaeoglobus TaxID=2643606 RepID=UPI0025BCD96C|nr:MULTISPECIES: PAS domain S-box protein [unclassified Archaeoglobus]
MKIKIEVSSGQNRKLLVDFLSDRYEIVNEDFDLLIVDSVRLKQRWGEIERLKNKSREFLPVLLITTREDIELAKEHIWKRVDEVVVEPVEKIELLTRIEILLRARKQALELRKYAEMLELGLLFESIGHPVVVISPDFEILYANRTAKELLKDKGISKIEGEKCYRVFHGRDEPAENCPCLGALKNGEFRAEEMEVETLGGTYLVSVTPVYREGKLEKIIHIAVDITELKEARKRIEMLYKANRIMHEVERAILSAEDVSGILKTVTKRLSELLPLKGTGITLFEDGKAKVVAVKGSEIFREGDVLNFKKLEEVVKVLGAGKPWVVNRIKGETEGEKLLMREGIKSFALIPIIADDLLGSINLASIKENAFTGEMIEILQEVAQSVALAVRSTQIRRKLEESEEMFRKLAENAQVGVDIIQNDVFIYVNRKFAEMLGYKPEELIGRNPAEFIHPEDREVYERYYRERVSGKKDHVNYKLRIVRRDGKTRILDAYGSRVEVEGKPAVVGISVDVTEEEKMKEELENYAKNLERMIKERTKQLAESEARYRSLVESPIVAFWEADASGVFTFVNDRLLEMSGYTRDEVVGKMTMFDPIAPELREWLAERIRLHKERKLFADVVEAELIRKDGSRFHVLVSPSPIYDERGNLVKIVGAMIDITDRKRAEERLKQTLEELKRVNEELETYVNAISHDLKAPLRNLQGYVTAMLEDYGEKVDEGMKFYLSRIDRLAERMDSLVNDLLEYARISKHSLTTTRVDVSSVIKDVLEHLEDEIHSKDAKIEIAEMHPVKGDRKLLFTIMLNLISNALKFVEKDVKPEIKIWSERINGRVRIFVRDNGIGIPEQYHERIFNIFERLHGEEVYPGTGVGLAIVKKAVEIIGGEVGLQSRVGEGSTFWIELEVWEDGNGENTSG